MNIVVRCKRLALGKKVGLGIFSQSLPSNSFSGTCCRLEAAFLLTSQKCWLVRLLCAMMPKEVPREKAGRRESVSGGISRALFEGGGV